MSVAEIVQIVLASLTLLATASIPIAVFCLQSHHEKEIASIEEKRIHHELEEKAHAFLSENSKDLKLLPLCAIASSLHRHDSYEKAVFGNFCKCPIELQNEILKQANIKMRVPKNSDWVEKCFDKLEEDRNKHNLGRNYLYEGAKYFHRNYTNYRDKIWDSLDSEKSFRTIALRSGTERFFGRDPDAISFLDYVEEYFCFLYSEHKPAIYNKNPLPPFDYVWEEKRLANSEEIETCRWIMEAVYDVVVILHNRQYGNYDLCEVIGGFQPTTFMEKYYLTLLWMYFTYCRDEAVI